MTKPEERRLYIVTVETEVLVVARSRQEAVELAQSESIDFDDSDYHAVEMTYMPGAWDKECMPYGLRDEDDPDRSVEGWIEAGAAPVYRQLLETRKKKEMRKKEAKK